MKNVKSHLKTLFILVFAAIALTLGSCSLDHGQVDGSKLDTYKVVFIFNDAAGTVVSTKELEVVKGETLLVSQIPQIRDQLKADGYEIPSSYEFYWVLLNDEKEPIDLDPEAEVNNLLNITEAICDSDGKVYVQVAYKQFGGTVSFFSNGGSPVEAIVDVEVGQSLQGKQPADPTKVGYTFVGWYDKTLTNLFDWNTLLPEEGIQLYAKWEANEDTAYLVEHYLEALDGSYKLEKAEKLAGTTDAKVVAKALEVEGFTHDAKHPEALESAEVLADGSLVLRVYYARNSYIVTFDAAGGDAKASQEYKYGQVLDLGYTLRTGYTFAGWLLNGKVFNEETMPAKDLELTASWIEGQGVTYKVEHYFEALDGSYVKDAKVETLFGSTGSKVEAALRNVAGFEHNEEHKDALESAEVLADGSLVLRVYYARSVYTVSFDAMGGVAKEAQEYKYGQALNLGETTKVGYTFDKWLYQGNALVIANMPAYDMELTAVWAPNKDTAYLVEHYFEQLDGSYKLDAKVDELEGTTDAKVSAVARKVTGFTHDPKHASAYETAYVLADGSLVLKVYYSRNVYTLTVNVDGAKQEVEYSYEEKVATPASPSKVGYTFANWSPVVPATMPAENVEVVAEWTVNQYTLTINVDGVKQEVEYDYNEVVETPASPSKTGYTFAGWSPVVPATMPAEDVEVVAQWTINQYTLTINVDGVKQEVEYDYNEAVETPASPSKTGYTFAGWSPVVPATMPAEDVEVVAQWTINQYTLTINVEGVKQEVKYDYLEAVATPASPEKVGYTFAGWSPIVPATMPAEDVEVVAQWTVNQYTLTINVDGVKQEVEYDYKEAVETPVDPSKIGYVFVGWSPVVPATMPAEDVEVVAQWEDTVYTVTYELDGGNAIPTYEFEIYNYNHIDWSTAGTMTVLTNVPGRVTKWAERIIVEYDETSGLYKSVDLWPYNTSNGTIESGQYILAGYYKDDYKQINLEASLTVIAIAKYLAENPNATVYFDLDIPSATNKEWKYMTKAYTSLELLDNVAGSNVIKHNENVAELPQLEKENHIFLGWYSENTFENKVESLVRGSEHKALTLYAKWIHVLDNAKNIALAAFDEYIKSDEIVNATEYELKYEEFKAELEIQRGLIKAADSIENVEKALENAKKALLIIVEPVAPSSIVATAKSTKPMVGASLALQLAFEGPEGYQSIVSYASSNEVIATVENGIVKFLSEGTVTITVASLIDPSIKTTIEFTVVAKDVTTVLTYDAAVETDCVEYEENYYYYGVNLFASLDSAINASVSGSTIYLLDGKYTLGRTINKSLTFEGQSKAGVEITVTADEYGNIAASDIVFDTLTLRGSASSTSGGIYFQPSSAAHNLTFQNCIIKRMNTFYKGIVAVTNPVVLTIKDSEISDIGQFLVWVTKGFEAVHFTGNNMDLSSCGGVSNSAGSMFRIRFGSAYIYDNVFTGDVKKVAGLLEANSGCTLVDVRFNTFVNVTKYVYINGGGTAQFDRNLYLNANQEVLAAVPATIKGAGVSAGTAVDSEATRAAEYAYFIAPSKSLTLNLNGGTLENAPTSYKVGYGLVLPTPTKTDYDFLGWFDNAECTGAPIESISNTANQDVVLYAGWAQNIVASNITYELNGGTAEGLPTEYIEGLGAVLPVASKAGYTFLGWFLNEGLTGEAVSEISASATGDIKLYAGFEAIEYTIEYDLDAGSFNEYPVKYATKSDLVADFMSDYNKLYGTAHTKPEETHRARTTNFWKNAEMYAKWKWMLEYFCDLAAEQGFGSNTSYYTNMYNGGNGIGTVSGYVTQSVTTYLLGINGTIWNEQYKATYGDLSSKATTLDFTAESGNEYQEYMIFAPRTYNADLEVTLIEPTREGYTFLGWYDNEEFAGEKVTVIAKGTLGNKKYYASWEETVYNVTYELNEGTFALNIEATKTALEDELLKDLISFYNREITKTNFATVIKNTDTSAYYFFESKNVDENGVTFADKYGWLRDYIIQKRSQDATYSSGAAELSNANSQYWRFEMQAFLSGVRSGWPYSANWADETIIAELEGLLKAKKVVKSYTVNSEAFSLVTPVRANHDFLGWYDNAEFNGEAIESIKKGSTGNVTLYAKWQLKLANADATYTVSFSNKAQLLDAFLYDFYQFLLEKGTITNEVTFDEFSGRNNAYVGKWFEYQQLTYDPTTGTVFTAAGYSYKANHMIKYDESGNIAVNEEYFFNSTKYGAKWYSLGTWINKSIGTSKRFFTSMYGGCELLRWASGATGESYGASFDSSIYLETLTWKENYNTASSSTMPIVYKHGATFKGWLDGSSNLYVALPVSAPVELSLTPSWQ